MQPMKKFRHCPACGAALANQANPLVCPACPFKFFFNPTVATAAFIRNSHGEVLFIRRATDPAKGMLGLPGGFIDIGENAEDGLTREIIEEVGLHVRDVQYLCSCTNNYVYQDVTYPVCDLIFTAVAVNPDETQALDGVAGYEWRKLHDVAEAELAFPSMKMGLRVLQERR
jgi:ADP-ribose pyrophosphatase YjhB (NUDIX family)